MMNTQIKTQLKATVEKNSTVWMAGGWRSRTYRWVKRGAIILGISLGTLALLLLWYLFPVLTMAYDQSSVSLELATDWTSDSQRESYGLKRLALGWFNGTKSMDRTVRVLILGFDENSSAQNGRTDVIMVAEMDPKKGVGIVSVPRDLWVPIPDVLEVEGRRLLSTRKDVAGDSIDDYLAGRDVSDSESDSESESESDSDSLNDEREYNRINTVYRLGNRYFGKGMGHRALKKVLAEELDLNVDYTVAIDYEGVRQVIDAAGGVEVNVQCPIRDNFVSPTSPGGYEPLSVQAGRQILSGHQALLFMRSRHGRTDMDRSRRQQMVLVGLRNQLLSDGQFLRLPGMLSQMLRFVKTDADIETILEMAVTMKQLRGGLHGLVLRAPLVARMQTEDGKSVVVLNRHEYMEKKKKIFAEKMPGTRKSQICPSADVALNWRKLKKKINYDSDDMQ